MKRAGMFVEHHCSRGYIILSKTKLEERDYKDLVLIDCVRERREKWK